MDDLHPLLQPYVPSATDPFDTVKAAHLLNRAGFGGTPAEMARVRKLGPQDAADALLDFPDAPAEELSEIDVPDLSSIDGYPKNFKEVARLYRDKTEEEKRELRMKLMSANREALEATVAWWLRRMTFGPYPLQEKLTLFWHGHFTTSARDERSASAMWKQNETLRTNAVGNFRTFVKQISRDPAMLDYLNNSQNRKAHPNENYGRELMELFTLGIGNYTETDVKQGARCFTGWAHDGDDFVFRKFDHDYGTKYFLGHVGNFNGDDAIDIILSQPACPRFIGSKLFRYFGYEEVDDSLAGGLASVLLQNNYELRPLVRTILTSKAFYSQEAIGSQIKSPVQLVLGTVRLLELQMPSDRAMLGALRQMGQVPFDPPNVRGWVGGRMWINTSTLFVRYNTAMYLAGSGAASFPRIGRKLNAAKNGGEVEVAAVDFDPAPTSQPSDAQRVVDDWVNRLIQRPIAADKKAVLASALGSQPQRVENLRKMVQLIVSMPEYQLC